jgi:predicted DNA-binding transcriptional regulator AlpA
MQTYTSQNQSLRLLSERQVAGRLGLTSQQFVDVSETYGFPSEVYLTKNVWGWLEHEIDDYIDLQVWHRDSRIAESQEAEYQKLIGQRLTNEG